MEGKRSKPKTFDGKMKCKFCDEKDERKFVERISALRGKIVKRVVVCIKCLGRVLGCPDNGNHQDR